MRPPSIPEPVGKSPTVVAAAIAGTVALIGSVFTFLGPIIVANIDGEQPEKACTVVLADYRELVKHDRSMAEILTKPHGDGKSIIQSDEDAVRCHVDGQTLNDMVPAS